MPLSKKQIAEKKEIQLEKNVRLLRSGAWGYIHNKVAIFQSKNAETCNSFSKWAKDVTESGIFDSSSNVILETAKHWQKLEGEPKILPKCHLCDAPHWYAGSNNYEAVVRQQSIMTNK